MERCTRFREDFVVVLQALLGGVITDHVLSFGPLSKNNEWFLCLKTDSAKDNLLGTDIVKVR